MSDDTTKPARADTGACSDDDLGGASGGVTVVFDGVELPQHLGQLRSVREGRQAALTRLRGRAAHRASDRRSSTLPPSCGRRACQGIAATATSVKPSPA